MSPSPPQPGRRLLIAASLAAALPVRAQQPTPIRFQLDSRIDGPAALFVAPAIKGLFKGERLDVHIDAGDGSMNTVTRVASGGCEMGFADFAALMEFHANNPSASKPVAVMVVFSNTPAAVLTLRKTGIRSPADLSGRRIGAPSLDAGRRTWSIFARANKIDEVSWTTMDAPLRETMLIRGEVDAITAAPYTSQPLLETRGASADEIVVMPFAQHGVKLYGHVIIAGEDFVQKHPAAVKSFLRAFTRGVKDVIADPAAAIALLKKRDGALDEALELRRLRMALEQSVLTADARADGWGDVNGSRLSLMASQVSDAFRTRERVNPNAVWNGSWLPALGERNIFGAARP